MPEIRILILYPDPAGLALLTSMLKSPGHIIEGAANHQLAARLMERNDIDVVLAGVEPGNGDVREVLTFVRRQHHELPVVLLFPRLHPDRAKEALRLGAMAVLKYPVPAVELRAAVLQALENREKRRGEPGSVAAARSPQRARESHAAPPRTIQPASLAPALTLHAGNQTGNSSIPVPSTVAVRTPSPGAMTLHIAAISSAHSVDQISRDLGLIGNDPAWRRGGELASALAPTSASVLIVGERGTGKSLVARLLHALGPEAHFLPEVVGEARLLVSTSENLPLLIEQGRLRQELVPRVSAVSLMLPPLRHRGTDAELLAESFRARYAQEFHKPVAGFTRDALAMLRRHDWPGNIRELEAAIRRAVAICRGARITSGDMAPFINRHHETPVDASAPGPNLSMGIRPLKKALEEPEKRIIIQALQAGNWNRQETARALNINRTTLYKKMKKYGFLMDKPVWAN